MLGTKKCQDDIKINFNNTPHSKSLKSNEML